MLLKKQRNFTMTNILVDTNCFVAILDTTDTIVWISEEIKKFHPHIIKLVRDNHGLLNYNDCFLSAYMLKNKIKNIISFDNDFDSIPGFNRISNRSFELK